MGVGQWATTHPLFPAETARILVHVAVTVGLPAVGAWLAARPSDRRSQAGLLVLATWGLLAVPKLVPLPGPANGLNLVTVVVAGPMVGLMLASWAQTKRGGLPWNHFNGWGHRLAGLGVAVYLPAVVLSVATTGPAPAQGAGFWGRLVGDGALWLPASMVLGLAVAVAVGIAVARLDASLALAPAAVVAANAVAHVGGVLLGLAPSLPLSLSVPGPVFALQVATAITAVAATVWLRRLIHRRTVRAAS